MPADTTFVPPDPSGTTPGSEPVAMNGDGAQIPPATVLRDGVLADIDLRPFAVITIVETDIAPEPPGTVVIVIVHDLHRVETRIADEAFERVATARRAIWFVGVYARRRDEMERRLGIAS